MHVTTDPTSPEISGLKLKLVVIMAQLNQLNFTFELCAIERIFDSM